METLHQCTDESQINRKKTHSFLDWANFLVALALPLTITIYTIIQNKNDNQIAQANRQQDAYLANRTRQLDIFLADDQQKETVLNNYFRFLSKLLEEHGSRLNRKDKSTAQTIARLNTLSALEQLDLRRKTILIRALYEARLLYADTNANNLMKCSVIPLNGANLSYIDLSVPDDDYDYRLMFHSAFLRNIWLHGASFRGVRLDESDFRETNLNYADFRETQVLRTSLFLEPGYRLSFTDASLKHTRFTHAYYCSHPISFMSAMMDDADLQHTECCGCIFSRASMIRSNLSYAVFRQLQDPIPKQNLLAFRSTKLINSTMYNTTFNNQSFINTTMNGSNMLRAYFRVCTFIEVTMVDASLEESRIENSSFSCSVLSNVTFRNAKLYNVTFNCTELTNTKFINADLRQCVFNSSTDLNGSDFTDASLIDVIFDGSSISYEQLTRARILNNVILSNRTLNINNNPTRIL